MNTRFQLGVLHLELGDEMLRDPVVLLVAVGDEDVVEAAHVLLVHGAVLPPLLHQPERDEEPPSVGGHNEEQEHRVQQYVYLCRTHYCFLLEYSVVVF